MSYVSYFTSSIRGALSSKKIPFHRNDKSQHGNRKEYSRRSIPPLECFPVKSSKLVVESDELVIDKPEIAEEVAQADAAIQQAARNDQHCILFPTYATRSKSGDAWQLKVKGWAFTHKESRRRRFVMSIARRIAGVTRADTLNEALEARMGMFLANNVVNETFTIDVTGINHATKMEIEGDPNDDIADPSTDDLMAEEGRDLSLSDESLTAGVDQAAGPELLNDSDIMGVVENGFEKLQIANTLKVEYSRAAALDSLQVPAIIDDEGVDLSDVKPSRLRSSSSASIKSTSSVNISTIHTGHFEGTIKVTDDAVSQWIQEANMEIPEVRLLQLKAFASIDGVPEVGTQGEGITHGVVNLVPEFGLSIISDIDDTIKDTGITSGARVVLANTFLYDPKDVPGMADLYQYWYHKGASIHYVSNSPWALFPMIRNFFRKSNFPPGSAHLRFYPSLLSSAWHMPGQQKRNNILEIMDDFPQRQFVLIGDSGEIDLEIYARIARENPGRVLAIFIRDLRRDGINTTISAKTQSYALYGRAPSTQSLISSSSSSSSLLSSATMSQPPTGSSSSISSLDPSASTPRSRTSRSTVPNSYFSLGLNPMPLDEIAATPPPVNENSAYPVTTPPLVEPLIPTPPHSTSSRFSSFTKGRRNSRNSPNSTTPPRTSSPPAPETLETRIAKASEDLPEGLIRLFRDPADLKNVPAVQAALEKWGMSES